MNLSIKNRIAFISTISVAVLSLLVFIVIYQSLRITSYAEIDEKLEFEAAKHQHELIYESDTVYFAYAKELLEREHLEIEVFPIYVEIVDATGKLLVKLQNLREEQIIDHSLTADKIIFSSYVKDQPLRQIQLPLVINEKTYGHMAIAVSFEDTLAVLQNLKQNLIFIYPILLIITFFGSRFISKITIQPLTKIADTVEIISAKNLNLRVEEIKGNDELSMLSKSINKFLDRIHESVEKEKQFTAIASHQLRTPLTAIRGNLEVLLLKKRDVAVYEQEVQETIYRIDRLYLVLDNLLTLARFDEDAKHFKKTDVDLVEIINSKIKMFKAITIQKKLRIILKDDLNSRTIETNTYFLKIILENLLSNAVKYSLTKQPVYINLGENEVATFISIKNTGGGLMKEEAESIFEIFYRSGNNTEKGHGIGLALVKKATNLLGGKILVDVETDQTTFTLQIPK
jgi:signal transduction histidine kinase